MNEGDLIYIPQGVNLFNYGKQGPMSLMKTDKPVTAVFLGNESVHVCNVFVGGIKVCVDKKYVYSMDRSYAS